MKNPVYFPERGESNGSGADCCLNMYTACDMLCTFCDIRERRHKTKMTPEEFAASTDWRNHILRALSYQMAEWRADGEKDHNVLLSPLCDPYPLGRDTMLTRHCINIIKQHGHHVTILTRNPDPRDFDLLDEYDTYGVSICCAGRDRPLMEPNCPPPADRVKLMFQAQMRSKCATMLYIAPLIDAIFARDAIRHIDVNRYVICRPRGMPCRGIVTDDELRELAGHRIIEFERNKVWEKSHEGDDKKSEGVYVNQ